VFGSLLASRYVHELAPSLGGLADPARHTAQDSLAGALGVAGRAGGTDGAGLAAAARDAWMSGFSLSLMIGTVIIAGAALLAYKGLPDTAADDEVLSREFDDEFEHVGHFAHQHAE